MTDDDDRQPDGGEVGTVHIAAATPDHDGIVRPPKPVPLADLLELLAADDPAIA